MQVHVKKEEIVFKNWILKNLKEITEYYLSSK